MRTGGFEIMTTPTKRMMAAQVLKRLHRSPGSRKGETASTMQGEEKRIVAASPGQKDCTLLVGAKSSGRRSKRQTCRRRRSRSWEQEQQDQEQKDQEQKDQEQEQEEI